MPVYDVACLDCGVNEVLGTTTEARSNALRCGYCHRPAPQHFSPAYRFYGRIDAGGEAVEDAKRRADGTAEFNLGLPGIDTPVGTRPDGKPRLSYRPVTHAELGSNRGVREAAKRAGLDLVDGGRYRTTPR